MNPEFLPDDPEDMLFQIVEEASEVIKAVSKIKRFGHDGRWPKDNPSNNLADLMAETEDLRQAVNRYAARISTLDLIFRKQKTKE